MFLVSIKTIVFIFNDSLECYVGVVFDYKFFQIHTLLFFLSHRLTTGANSFGSRCTYEVCLKLSRQATSMVVIQPNAVNHKYEIRYQYETSLKIDSCK